MKHFTLKISGLVQGVGFRFLARKKAELLNLRGSAKNNPDGTILIEVEGGEKNLEDFIDWCHVGPPSAKVKNVEVREGELKNFTNFLSC